MVELSPNQVVLFDKKFKLQIAKDFMSVSLTIPTFKWPAVKVGQVVKYLKMKKIVEGIDKESIKIAIANRNEKVIIVKGKAPVEGANGSYEILFDKGDEKKRPKVLESGSVDYRELSSVICVDKEKPLIKIVPEVQGTAGINVQGKEIEPSPVSPPKIQCGQNVYLNQDDNIIYSLISGLPILTDTSISVTDTVTIDQDIDYSIGNLDIPCNLVIKGAIQEGFNVNAIGDITVMGEINNAFVTCGGNLKVKDGINNKNNGKILVNQSLSCKFMNFAKVDVAGDINVNREIMFSNVACGGTIKVTKEEGIIIGGEIVAGNGLIANEIGSKVEAATTKLTVCPVDELSNKLDDIAKELTTIENSIKSIETEIVGITQYLESSTITSEEFTQFETIYEEFTRKLENERIHQTNLNEEKKQLEYEIYKMKAGEIKVKKVIYPGVRIKIKKAHLMTIHEEHRLAFYLEKSGSITTKLL